MAKKIKLPQNEIKMGFNNKTVDLKFDKIMPLRPMTETIRSSKKYAQIAASIREVGIIEPPVVSPDPKSKTHYILLDGHLRLEALKQMGEEEVTCLISTDDESFTYNKHINRLSTIQEHRMIIRAVERGVPEEKIAQALNINVSNIVSKRNLLNGICDEAIEMLKDKMIPAATFSLLRRMKAGRQIDVATLMNDASIYTAVYARALFAATPKAQLVNPEKPKKIRGLDDDQIARMENETESLQSDYHVLEENYGTEMLNLTIAKTYLSGLLSNARIVRYLAQHHAEILAQFQKVAEMKSLTKQAA